MAFPAIQAAYAAHGVATYPLKGGKTPAVRGYDRIGAPYSAQLAMTFKAAEAAGFVAGPRNRVTIVDVDSTDPRLVDEVERLFGPSPLCVATPRGGCHLYYRHDGELRDVGALPKVDLLGGGNVVAAGSRTPKGRYEIVRGTLDDLDRLPRLLPAAVPPQQTQPEKVPAGKRNNSLFKYCQSIVGHCDDEDALVDAARSWAGDQLAAPLPEHEIVKTCSSVWTYRGGRKRIVNHVIDAPVYGRLLQNTDALALLAYLSAENGSDAEFMVADGLGEARGWPRRFVPAARKVLVDLGIIECIRQHRPKVAALYRWRVPT